MAVTVPILTLLVFLPMLAEWVVSARHVRRLRARGAIEPADDVFRALAIVYPGAFLLMAVEGGVRGTPPAVWLVPGLVLFLAAKSLKYLAIRTLGDRWSFRVLVVPGVPPVTTGVYRVMRHPNYVAVFGELIGAAVMMRAPLSGLAVIPIYALVLRRRIPVEERALGRPARDRAAPTAGGGSAS